MSLIPRLPRCLWRFFHFPPQLAYTLGLGPLIGRMVLLLTTRGRRSGQARVTPLQYEEIDGSFYVAAARGERTDWLRNIAVYPRVEVRAGRRRLKGDAEVIRDPAIIADFLKLRLQRHPRMIRAIMHTAGLPGVPTRADLEEYALGRPLVVIHPLEPGT